VDQLLVKNLAIDGTDHTFNRHVWEQRVFTGTADWLGETP